MEEEKVEVKENKKRKISFIILPIIIIVIISSFVFWRMYTDKSYKIEEITEFLYFKLYENEKYGVIDSKRKYFSRAEI